MMELSIDELNFILDNLQSYWFYTDEHTLNEEEFQEALRLYDKFRKFLKRGKYREINNVTYKAVKEANKPEYWVAMKDGKVIAQSMSEGGVRTIVMTIANKQKKKDSGAYKAESK